MIIRETTEKDEDGIWEISREVIQKGDTYVFLEGMTKDEFINQWISYKTKAFVAESDGEIMGSYIIKANQIGRGSHIANCSYIVRSNTQGEGIGGAMCEHSIETAKSLGYKAIQFNMVVSTNEIAINLWQKYGFKIVGTVPKAFDHKEKGLVDAFIMHLSL